MRQARGVREWANRMDERTKHFAVQVFRLSMRIRLMPGYSTIAHQVQDAASSVASNQRACRRARSLKEFAAKLQIVNEEIDEAAHWLDTLRQVLDQQDEDVERLLAEALDLRGVYARATRTVRLRLDPPAS